MKSFEDQIPEEQKEEQGQIIARLRGIYRQEQVLSAPEQEESIRRVRERLEHLEEQGMEHCEQPEAEIVYPLVFPKLSRSAGKKPFIHAMGALAAMLVIGVLIGSSFLLFAQLRSQKSGPSTRPVGTNPLVRPSASPTSAEVQWDGLKMNMHITPGPYFLGELLAVDLSLTNHTHPAMTLGGTRHSSDNLWCGYSSLAPELSGGTSPHYLPFTTPVLMVIACNDIPAPGPYYLIGAKAFTPGQTITGHFYVLLTSSGDATLTGAAFFYVPPANASAGAAWQRNAGPLTGHLPLLHIHVMPQVPADRQFSIEREDANSAAIQAPGGLHLLAQTYVICQNSDGYHFASGTIWARDYWQPLSKLVVQRPDCNESGLALVQWKYAVGAVGYEAVQGTYSSPIAP